MSRGLPPLDPDTFSEPMAQVVRWHLLMNAADDHTRATGRGLANVWGHIRDGDYRSAARALAEDRAMAHSIGGTR